MWPAGQGLVPGQHWRLEVALKSLISSTSLTILAAGRAVARKATTVEETSEGRGNPPADSSETLNPQV